MKRLIAVMLAAILAIALGGCGRSPQVQEQAPAFKLPYLMDGKTVNFPRDFRGYPVALIFFSPG
ncbi:MAG: hypothetical protein K6U74_16850 [Firmicutes bacterium]|nr:hypothetical protein [Bacillota bacterium]